MADSKRFYMMEELDLKTLIDNNEIRSELEYQRALMADRLLSQLAAEHDEAKEIRQKLVMLFVEYEKTHWSTAQTITDQQVAESEEAEALAFSELKFTKRRRELILDRLKELNLKQKDLGTLLSHNKSYTSELLNGMRAFSTTDLILIHKLLKIELKYLFMTALSAETKQKVGAAIEKIAAGNKKAKIEQLALANK